MIPVVCFVASSGAGKTTLLVQVIAELTKRGFRIGAIKHTHHELALQPKGKDSARHAEAGAALSVIAAPNGFSFTGAGVWPLDDLIGLFRDVDLIIVEGYKNEPKPKIEVMRAAHSTQSVLNNDPLLIAVASDFPYTGPARHFDLADVKSLCDFIEARFLA